MRRVVALSAGALALLLVVVAGMAVTAPRWGKPLIEGLVARDGRQTIALNGPISFSLLPRPRLRAEDVVVSAGAGRIEAGRLMAELALAPLLSRRIVVARLDIDHAVLYPAPGDVDRVVSAAAPPAPPPASLSPGPPLAPPSLAPHPGPKPRHWRISLVALRLTDARLAGAGGAALSVVRVDLPALPGPVATPFDIDARYGGIPFSISGMIARVAGDGVSLSGVKLVAPEGDLALEGVLHLAAPGHDRPSFAGKLTLHRLDLDLLRHALGPSTAKSAPPGSASGGAQGAQAAAGAPAAPGWRGRAWPFALLRAADLNLALAAGRVVESGATYHDLATHVSLADGHLVLDPLRLEVPGGAVSGALGIDAAADPPSLTLHLVAPSLALAPLAAAFHWPADNAGALEVFADLAAKGATAGALASDMSGRIGIAAVNAALDNRLLLMALGGALRRAELPTIGLDLQGRSEVRCLAVRAEITHGVMQVAPALAQSPRLDLGAAGTLDLGGATMDLRLVPSLRIGGNALVVPLRLTGALAAPGLAPDPVQADGALAAEPCEAALALARNGQAGPAPAPRKPEKGISLKDILRGLGK